LARISLREGVFLAEPGVLEAGEVQAVVEHADAGEEGADIHFALVAELNPSAGLERKGTTATVEPCSNPPARGARR
jgi:hypothetical protein